MPILSFFAWRINLTEAAEETCAMWTRPNSLASRISRATMTSSASDGMPGRTISVEISVSFIAPPAERYASSQWEMTGTPNCRAYSRARRMVSARMTGLPSSEKATAPSAKQRPISASASPLSPFVMAAIGRTLTTASFFALATIYSTTAGLSIGGSVLARQQMVVKPPSAAALAPLLIVSLSGRPGSRRCVCMSIRPGRTHSPFASMISASSCPLPLAPNALILPSSISISLTSSTFAAGAMTRPPLISMLFIRFYFFPHARDQAAQAARLFSLSLVRRVGRGATLLLKLHALERHGRRSLLGLFFVAAAAEAVFLPPHPDLDPENAPVLGAGLFDDAVVRQLLFVLLRVFLERRFIVADIAGARDRLDLLPQPVDDEVAGLAEAGVKIERADQRFKSVGEVRFPALAAAPLFVPGEKKHVAEAKFAADPGEGLVGDDRRPDLGQVAFGESGEFVVEVFSGGELQNGVAQELQTLVVGKPPFVAVRAVGQRLVEQIDVQEGDPELDLEIVQFFFAFG